MAFSQGQHETGLGVPPPPPGRLALGCEPKPRESWASCCAGGRGAIFPDFSGQGAAFSHDPVEFLSTTSPAALRGGVGGSS